MKKININTVIFSIILLVTIIAGCVSLIPKKDTRKTNETKYTVYVDDEADLLTEKEEENIKEKMQSAAVYGNVGFITISGSGNSIVSENATKKAVEIRYRELYGKDSAALLCIDMSSRYIYIFSDGKMYQYITKSKANEITDNAYIYATGGNYYECAEKIFDQIEKTQYGVALFSPVKIINNFLLAFSLALILVSYLVFNNRYKEPSERQPLFMSPSNAIKKFNKRLVSCERVEVESAGGAVSVHSGGLHSSGGHSSGSRSSGGGHHSGGGGGHHF